MTLPDQRRYDRKHMNNHTQQFASSKCVRNFQLYYITTLVSLVRYMSSLLGPKNVHGVFPERALFVRCSVM